eukprot:6196461-Pleurochrysis_carterae.AAC.5
MSEATANLPRNASLANYGSKRRVVYFAYSVGFGLAMCGIYLDGEQGEQMGGRKYGQRGVSILGWLLACLHACVRVLVRACVRACSCACVWVRASARICLHVHRCSIVNMSARARAHARMHACARACAQPRASNLRVRITFARVASACLSPLSPLSPHWASGM